jgi:glutamate 5-kinase
MIAWGGPVLIRAWMQQVRLLKRDYNIEVIWVSSGAIVSALERTSIKRGNKVEEKQALSAIGQPLLMDIYNISLQATGLMGSQVLLTADDLRNPKRRKNFQNTINQLIKWKAVPILNENDAVVTDEIKFGDNDTLSAMVAQATKADKLIILTDVDGLYDRDPRANKKAKLIREVDEITSSLLKAVGKSPTSKFGTGGMLSKLRAAQEAAKAGIETVLIRGDLPSVLLTVARQKFVGTVIYPLRKKKR